MHKEIKGPVNGKSIADTDTAISTLPIMNGDSIVVALRLSSTSGLGNLSIAEVNKQPEDLVPAVLTPKWESLGGRKARTIPVYQLHEPVLSPSSYSSSSNPPNHFTCRHREIVVLFSPVCYIASSTYPRYHDRSIIRYCCWQQLSSQWRGYPKQSPEITQAQQEAWSVITTSRSTQWWIIFIIIRLCRSAQVVGWGSRSSHWRYIWRTVTLSCHHSYHSSFGTNNAVNFIWN